MAADPTQLRDLSDEAPRSSGALVEAWSPAAWRTRSSRWTGGPATGSCCVRRGSPERRRTRRAARRDADPLDHWPPSASSCVCDATITGTTLGEGDRGSCSPTATRAAATRSASTTPASWCGAQWLRPGGRGADLWSVPGATSSELHHLPGRRPLGPWPSRVDGDAVAAGTGFRLLMAMAPFEGIDVGLDRRSPVCWKV